MHRHELLRVRGHRAAWLPPLLLLGGIALVDLDTTGDLRVTSWCVLVPALAAAICRKLPLVDEVARAVAADPHTAGPDLLVALVRDGTLRHGAGHLADDTTVFAVRRLPGESAVPGRLQL